MLIVQISFESVDRGYVLPRVPKWNEFWRNKEHKDLDEKLVILRLKNSNTPRARNRSGGREAQTGAHESWSKGAKLPNKK